MPPEYVMSRFFKSAAFPILIVVVLAFFAQKLISPGDHTKAPNYGQFIQQVDSGQVQSATLNTKDNTIDFSSTVAGKQHKFTTAYPDNTEQSLTNTLLAHHVSVDVKGTGGGGWLSVLTYVLPFVIFLVFWLFIINQMQGGGSKVMSFGESRVKRMSVDSPKIAFRDVAGVGEAVEELHEIKEFLENPKKFQALGARIPKGVLLYGPPGTGKTLLARAVAGEAGVPFFSMSGSEFVEVLVGVGASRVRDLFDQAKKASPSIIFLDEIDAVGRQRGTSINSNDEREQTLNQLLVEMDGFDTRQAVVVIAATNRPDGLDKALFRPGRFDRRVTVERPDWNGRLAILKIHSRDVPLARDVDLITIARATPGMVGADLANLVNEAALLAARRNLDAVTQSCFDEALDKILIGAERPLILSEEDLNVVAYHEGGHALTGLLTENVDPVTKVTIVPRGQALGVTQYSPLDDRYNYSKNYLEAQLVTALGGRAAEEVAIGHITTGAENDLQRVTAIARQMVARWGMSERLGTVSFSERDDPFAGPALATGSREYSEQTAGIIDEEVDRIVKQAYTRAVSLLREHLPTLDRIARALRLYETIDAKQLREIMVETGAINAAPVAYRG